MRRLLPFLLGAALAVPAAAGAAVVLPRDHFGHPAASIEWWYFSGLVRDRAGTPYNVFFTLFASRGGLAAVSQVVNLRTGELVGHDEEESFGAPGTASLDVVAGKARLRYRAGAWTVSVATPGFALSLVQRPLKPYVLHGRGGVVQQGPAGPSHYYSATRMRAAGTLRAGGRTSAIAGESWFDHQWGGFRDDPRAFDWRWFSCRFADRTELMLYQFLDRATHRPLPRFAAGTLVARDGAATHVTSFSAQPRGRTLRAARRAWPLDWRLAIPAHRLTESLRAIVPGQLVRNRLVPTFWEGAETAAGTRAGTCFVELSFR